MTTATEFPTYAQLEADIEDELDIEVSSQSFIDRVELIKYCNKAIDQAEQIVHTIYEDYFLTRDTITFVSGTEAYAPPTNIYGMKIRALIYHSGTMVYEIKRIHDWRKFMTYRLNRTNVDASDGNYGWLLENTNPGAWRHIITPTPGSGTVERWYLRQSNRIVDTDDIMDIPEAKNYILAHMRHAVIIKEKRGNPEGGEIAQAAEKVLEEKEELNNTLAAMVVDADNEIPLDLTHYEEHT